MQVTFIDRLIRSLSLVTFHGSRTHGLVAHVLNQSNLDADGCDDLRLNVYGLSVQFIYCGTSTACNMITSIMDSLSVG